MIIYLYSGHNNLMHVQIKEVLDVTNKLTFGFSSLNLHGFKKHFLNKDINEI